MPVTTRSTSRRMAAAQAIPAAAAAAEDATTTRQRPIQYRRVNGKPGILISAPKGVVPTRRVVLTTGAKGQKLTRIRGPGDRLLIRVPGKTPAAKTPERRLSTFVRGGRTWIRIRPAVQDSQKQGQ
ncbi:hypothetical protein PspLS_06121 [Pyricularia sp. CBS 133598]|nr:hypothetical protein PspLS_06121 [Pyricularia sp. CBS 133598]